MKMIQLQKHAHSAHLQSLPLHYNLVDFIYIPAERVASSCMHRKKYARCPHTLDVR